MPQEERGLGKRKRTWRYIGSGVLLVWLLVFMVGLRHGRTDTESYGQQSSQAESSEVVFRKGARALQNNESNDNLRNQNHSGAADTLISKLYAESAVLLDADTGRVLVGKASDTIRPMASTTKIMTCILALENGDPNDVVTVSSYAASQPKVHLGAPTGRTFYLKDLLYSLMLESHNDSAVMIAEHIGGSVEGFARMMNQKARDLGCENTCFVTPNGLDASVTEEDGTVKTHSTTAKELAIIMGYCVWQSPMKDEFLEITRTQNYYFTDLEGKGSYNCTNHNALLAMESGALSGKTGFTSGAGYSYVAALEDEGRHFTLALLGCGWPPHKTYKWNDARRLYAYGKQNYQWRDVYEEPELPAVPVVDGVPAGGNLEDTAYTQLTMGERELSLNFLMREDEQVEIQMTIPEQLTAPVYQNMAVGRIDYLLDEKVIRSFPIYTGQAVEAVSWKWCIRKIVDVFMC